MRIRVPAICLLCSAAFLFAAEPSWELAPPDAKVLIGVDIRGLRNSSLTESLTPQMRAQMQASMAMFHVPGIELLDDIDSVFLGSTGDFSPAAPPATKTAGPAAGAKAGDATSKAGAAASKPGSPFVLVISGTFPDEHLRPLLKGPHPSYKGINVYRGTGADPTSIAVLDEHTVLLGDDKSIYRAIDRKTTGIKAQGPLLARARELAAADDIWIVAQDASGTLQKATGPAAMFASEIEGVDMGLALRDGLNMDIGFATKTEAGAQMLAQLLSTQMLTTVNAKLDAQRAADFWRRMKISANGKRMQLQVVLTKEELRENIRLLQEQRAAGPPFQLASGQSLVAPQPAAPPKPAGPRVVKIFGLDDGVHEVRLDQTR